ncbi:hypothetical protein NL108_013446 [Boleophthalmus pectinirostris]|uniref:protein sprouty homolog 2 n=1 Tax=Boleophthalmus pectinirostris TaxID=150288 RepID=UPI000A1C66BE|nr:protein sprouty homolog 2 [Boleophthalmus pectinirostris]KAJ0062460.1 hypothetical protein NL108_013446 [Boleophthalmus pectinirostris]
MDPSRVSQSDGGGGPSPGPSPGLSPDLSPGQSSVSDAGDPGTAHPFPPDPREQPVLSLDQIRVTRSSNEYTDGPTAPAPRPTESPEERHHNLRNLQSSHSSGLEEPHSPRSSGSSPSSGQRLLGQSGSEIIRVQPKREQSPEELKPLTDTRTVQAVPGSGTHRPLHKPWDRCEECCRCRCPECVRPRVLPSCWMCGHRCVCSAHNVVEYGTCVCCVKGLFYHCSSDDEDTCADKPFSCSQPHCCVRWSAVSLLALFFPCLLCYLPARTCLNACQSCYDRATRPGCRCKDSHLRARDIPT